MKFLDLVRNFIKKSIQFIKELFFRNIRKLFLGLCLTFIINLALAGVILFPADQGKLAAHFFDIGQGDAIYLRLPNEQDILIDGGPDKTILTKLGEVMPFYDREIDLVVLTHPHADHLTGLIDVLQNYKVKKVWFTGAVHTTDEYLTLLSLIKEKGIEAVTPLRGEGFNFGETKVEILNPARSVAGERVVESTEERIGGLNDTSIVMRLIYGENKFLFTGDITSEVEEDLTAGDIDLKADVLKIAHHGSKFSSTREFVQRVAPGYAVIQVGRGNRYGHPAYRTLRVLEQVAAEIFRNDLNGDIKIISDGNNLKVKVEK